jgi:outer membrane protein assembly factor BamB
LSLNTRESKSEAVHAEARYRTAQRSAVIALAFCALVLLLLVANSIHSRAYDPMKAPRLQALLLELNRDPRNERLKREARRLDREVRTAYFRSRSFALSGFYLLLGGIGVFLLAMEMARACRRELPQPNPAVMREAVFSLAIGRRAVIALGAASGGLLLTLAVWSRHDAAAEYARAVERPQTAKEDAAVPGGTPSTFAVTSPAPAPPGTSSLTAPGAPAPLASAGSLSTGSGALSSAPAPPTGSALPPLTAAPVRAPLPGGTRIPLSAPAAPPLSSPSGTSPVGIAALFPPSWAQQWPAFRGPGGDGVAGMQDAPTTWDGTRGEGILWKTPVPLPGWNSPVVWGDRVFLAGAEKTKREVYCFRAKDGSLLWRRTVPLPPGAPVPKVSGDTGYAPSTMVTDGQHVCAIFPNGDIACFDAAGKPLWQRSLGVPDNTYGHASSLMMYGRGVLVQMDQGTNPKEAKSVLMALDVASGKTVWEVKRPVANSWSTPILLRAGTQEQLITCADPWVIAYDPRTGREIWRVDCLGGDVAPSPTSGGGYVFACNQGYTLAAIRPDGTGDVTKTAIAWTFDESLPDIASPLCDGALIYLVASDGMVTCVDTREGKKVWEHEFRAAVHASPVLVGKTVYLLDTQGVMHLFEAGRVFKEIGKAPLGEETGATPAFAGGRIYIRGREHLYCIGAKR